MTRSLNLTRRSIFLLALASTAVPAAAPARCWTHRPVGMPAAVAAAAGAGTVEPAASAFINASSVMPFVEGAVFHVYATPGRVTDIVLQPGEVLGAVASGDTARWVIGDTTSGAGETKRVHVLVKPYASGLATNLIITTDRRTYHLALTSAGGASMTSLAWVYPHDALIALQQSQAAAAAAAPVASGVDVGQLHFNYSISGDRPSWRPLRAFDDGRQTYIEFPESLAVGQAPPLFLVDAKRQVQLVNYRLRGRYYVVDRIFNVAELRLGTKQQDIVRIIRVNDAAADIAGRAS